MTIVRRIARPLLAAQFINGGIDQLRRPGGNAAHGGPVIPALAGKSVGSLTLPSDPEALVRLNGAIMTGAGSLLAIGRLPRISSLVLAGSLVPTTLTGHRFWERTDPDERRHDLHEVLKNAGLLGGLLIASVDTAGKPGLSWRAHRAARNARRTAKAASTASKAASKGAKKKAAKSHS
jgi:uncharacterized membrane protein YphA (DoxX/SURF4 family)